jgi:hypothetical protein
MNKKDYVVRTVTYQVIEGVEIKREIGVAITEVPLEPITVLANSMTEERALKELKKVYGKNKVIFVTDVIEHKVKYGVEKETFMEMATVLEDEKGDEE